MIALPQATERIKSGLQFRIFCFYQCPAEEEITKKARFKFKIYKIRW